MVDAARTARRYCDRLRHRRVTIAVTVAGVDGSATGNVRFAAGALLELGNVLHALTCREHGRPGGGPPAVPDRFRAELGPWAFLVRAIRARIFIDVSVAAHWSWDDCLRAVRRLDRDALCGGLLRPLGGAARAAGSVGRDDPHAAPVRLLLADPDGARDRLLAFLDACWESFYRDWWTGRAAALAEEVLHRRHLLDQAGLPGALRGLPGVSLLPDGRIALDKVRGKQLSARARRGLVLCPSLTVAPHLYVADDPTLPVTVLYPGGPAGPPPVPLATVTRRLHALAHPQRLAVARAIATEARSAAAIGRLWQLDRSRVARHLRALRAAGLATCERHGREVRYRLDLAELGALGPDLRDALLR
jgi:DNA-binding transcriptional ArsR family regulator